MGIAQILIIVWFALGLLINILMIGFAIADGNEKLAVRTVASILRFITLTIILYCGGFWA